VRSMHVDDVPGARLFVQRSMFWGTMVTSPCNSCSNVPAPCGGVGRYNGARNILRVSFVEIEDLLSVAIAVLDVSPPNLLEGFTRFHAPVLVAKGVDAAFLEMPAPVSTTIPSGQEILMHSGAI